jgi:hypothetical protein
MMVTGLGFPGVVIQSNGTVSTSTISIQYWSDSRLVIQLPVQDGGNWRYQVNVNGQLSPASTNVLAYDYPSISSVYPSIGPTRGGSSITLSGASFDTSGTVYVNSIAVGASSITSWTHSKIVFLLPVGQGTNIGVSVKSVIGYASTVTSATSLSYQPPSITAISPSTAATVNGGKITITGTNFGTSGSQNASIAGIDCANVAYTAQPSYDVVTCDGKSNDSQHENCDETCSSICAISDIPIMNVVSHEKTSSRLVSSCHTSFSSCN